MKKRLIWYGHVRSSEEGCVLRRMVDAPVTGKRRRGSQNARWTDSCNKDMESVGAEGGGRSGRDKVEE